MAEFCLECFAKLVASGDDAKRAIVSKELDLCEGCGKMKHVVQSISGLPPWIVRKINASREKKP